MNSIAYRTAQFLQALTPRAPAGEMARARASLPGPLFDLFQAMPPREQGHALAVYRSLGERGHRHPDLLAAALLHDLGRADSYLGLLERVLAVLGFRLLPRAARRWAAGGSLGWRRPFVVAARHAAWGAESVRRAGGSPLLVELIHRHHDSAPASPAGEADRLLQLLREADGTH
jgi:hypothetical protein